MNVSVKDLAEFVHRRGDIRYQQQSVTLAQEGIARQKSYQVDRGESYLREHRVSASFGDLAISGRIDGWDPAARLVEEIKTTRNDPTGLHAHAGDVHQAQLRLYGALLALADPTLLEVRLRLVYLHPVRPDETVFEETAGRDDLIGYFEATCSIYAAWIANVRARVQDRDRQLAGLGFPYGEFRTDQRRIAKQLFRGFRDGAHWLVEAPTGSGKTMAGLFAALKAMGEHGIDRLVFLTSRTTGQRAIEDALTDAVHLVESDSALTAVTVTAKDRICFGEGSCDRAECRFAQGYYERMPAARRQLLGRRLIRRGEVEAVAREHEVCPFELSLDVAAWADVVVCDYNYVFDPIVRLTRLDNPLFEKVGLIVDEAHQLGDRVRDMLGSSLSRQTMKAALAESGVPEPLARGLRSVDRALAAVASGSSGDETEIAQPEALLRAIERLQSAALDSDVDSERFPATSTACFEAFQFAFLSERAAEGTHHYISDGAGRDLIVELICTVPGDHIRDCMSGFQGSARVSGSLTPTSVFHQIHGAADSDDVLVSDGCFPRDHFGVFVVTDISTYYRDRDRTRSRIANLIQCVCTQTTGNYLVALPSFEYAQAVSSAVEGVDIRCQQPGMTLDEREGFIQWISEPLAGRVGFVVMGGVFGESVDFRDGALDGVLVIGAGLPPRSLKRDLIADDEAAAGLGVDGDEIAYRQPAMTRVVQAAGRVVRSASDRGVAVLVDPRFSNGAYRAFLPSRWMTRHIHSNHLADALGDFWFGRQETRANAREAAR